jgi:hypothetical protein
MNKALLFVFTLFSFSSIAQSVTMPVTEATINMGGGSATVAPGLTVDWSIGESAIIETFYGQNSFANSFVGINWNVTSGVLQPYDSIHIIYNYLLPAWTNQEIRFYPIPTPNIVFIDFRSVTTGKVSIQLYGRDGRLLGTSEFAHINGNSTQRWDLSNRASGIYFFRIVLTSDQGIILKDGTFEIEKNK